MSVDLLTLVADGQLVKRSGTTLAGATIGTDVQAHDADLTAIAALTTTTYGRALLTQANAAAFAQTGVTAGLPYIKTYTEATAATATRDVTGGTVIWINTDAGTTDPTNAAAGDLISKGI